MSATKKEEQGQVVTKAAVPKTKGKAPTKKSGTVMYIGPSIKGVATRNTIFNNGLPKALEKAAEKMPILHSLLIPVEKLPEARRKMTERNSSIRTCYEQVLFNLSKKEGEN